MSDQQVRMVVLTTDDLAGSIKFYTDTLGFALKFRDGAHCAALDGGSVTLALATSIDHALPGNVVVGIKTDDVNKAAKVIEEASGAIVTAPFDDALERRASSTTARVTASPSTVRSRADAGTDLIQCSIEQPSPALLRGIGSKGA